MFDIGWSELMLIGIVALIVIGPKDLPEMFRQLGRFTGKLRGMAREFQRAMDQAARESGASDALKDVKDLTSAKSTGLDAVKSAADRFEKWDPLKNAAKPTSGAAKTLTPAPMPASPVPLAKLPEPALTAATETVAGPATQALRDKTAAKAAVLKETAERLRAIEAGEATPAAAVAVAPVRKTSARTRTAKTAEPPAAGTAPRAPRKTKDKSPT